MGCATFRRPAARPQGEGACERVRLALRRPAAHPNPNPGGERSLKVRRVAVTALLLGVLTGCEDRFPAGAVYSAASNTSLQFGRDKDGKVLRLRPISSLDDAVNSISFCLMYYSMIMVLSIGERTMMAKDM